ncbi:MAG TPA: glycosyltransferase [Thermoanaerobaculia bacterium]|nr:glycosyltransferase [Thermoanaerobaculia bacterium]
MRICLLGKYPPIQGGVSTQCYWLARGLASRGHQVHVVTNANEVEAEFRIELDERDLGQQGEYAKRFPACGGFVQVHSTERPDRSRLYYIPLGNPTVTRLATIAADVIRREGCEVIFAYYLEPYGVAAHLASAWTAVPYVFKHAGSDLFRLLEIEELRTAYAEVLAGANRIISRGTSLRKLVSLGVAEERIASDVAFRIPLDHFHPDAEPLNLPTPESGGATPVLGVYGKVGEPKGSFDLLRAMARLADDGAAPDLVMAGGGWQLPRFLELARLLGVDGRLRLLPFMPHWRMPGFIRACDALVFLERGFPIAAHTPGIPEEILACGKCLVVSEEVARKQIYRYKIRDRQNLVVVSDPRDTDELAACLRFALEDPARADRIGQRGRRELIGERTTDDWIVAIEQLLGAVARQPPAARKLGQPVAASPTRRDPVALFERFFPHTAALVDGAVREALRAGVAAEGLGTIEEHGPLVEAVAEAAGAAIRHDPAESAVAAEVLRFERRRHAWASRRSAQQADAAPNEPRSVPAGDGTVGIRGEWELLEFDFDLEAVLMAIEDGRPIDPATRRTLVLLHAGSFPLWINEATALLLHRLGEASLPVSVLVDEMAEAFGGPPEERRRIADSCLSILEAMHWEGIVHLPAGWRPAATASDVPKEPR